MNCPKCPSGALSEHRVAAGLHVDLCPSCHGVWLDRSEIYFFVHKPHRLYDEFNKAFLSVQSSALRCPRCSQMMSVARIDRAEIDFEVCGSCSGTWFDAKEIEKLNAGLNSACIQTPPSTVSSESSRKPPANLGGWAGFLLSLGGQILRGVVEAGREIVPGLYECRIVYQFKNRRHELQEKFTGAECDFPAKGDCVDVLVHPWLPACGFYLAQSSRPAVLIAPGKAGPKGLPPL